MDADTQTIYREGQDIYDFLHTQAWPKIKARFEQKLLDLQSTRNIKPGKAEEVLQEVLARNAAVDILVEFMREVEGIAEQHKSNQSLMPNNEIIIQG